MRHQMKLGTAVAALAFSCATGVLVAGDDALPQCPVMGEDVNLSVSTPTKDGPVYFCCKGCVKKYTANPAKYAKATVAQRIAFAKRKKIQVTCPVTGEPVDAKVFTEYAGSKVLFCCKGCVKKFNADPAKYKSALANSYTYQTLCPVMGETIDPSSFAVMPTGETVYYCCNGCDGKFKKNPEKYTAKLASQGLFIDAAKLKAALHKSKGGDHSGHDHGDHGGHGHGG